MRKLLDIEHQGKGSIFCYFCEAFDKTMHRDLLQTICFFYHQGFQLQRDQQEVNQLKAHQTS